MSGKSTFGSFVLWIVLMVVFKIWGPAFLTQFAPIPPKAEQGDDYLDRLHKFHLDSIMRPTTTTGTPVKWPSTENLGRNSKTSESR